LLVILNSKLASSLEFKKEKEKKEAGTRGYNNN
jgi:hypothetical protein